MPNITDTDGIVFSVNAGENASVEVEKVDDKYFTTVWLNPSGEGDSQTFTSKRKAVALARKWAAEIKGEQSRELMPLL